MSTRPAEAAVIHDIRYSRFSGNLRPRWTAVLALARSSLLRALGIRRSAGAKVWPFLLVAAAYLPAVIAVGVPLVLGDLPGVGATGPLDILDYYDLLGVTGVIVLAFAATTLPSLLTRERRDRVLSLYFSTALSPAEYVVGKLLAAAVLVLLVTLGPMLLLLVGGILIADQPVDYAADHLGDWPRIALAAGYLALFQAAVALALGSLTARRVFAVGGYIALMLVPAVIGGVLYGLTDRASFLALNLLYVPIELSGYVLSPEVDRGAVPPLGVLQAVWFGFVGLGLATLLLRYTRGKGQ